MGMLAPSALPDHCAALTDPRCPTAPHSRPLLMDILLIAVCAVSSGAEGWEASEEYGKAHAAWCAALVDFPHGLPGHDTFRRVVSRVDPDELTRCFLSWTDALTQASGDDIVSIDGKTLRHAFDRASSTAAIPMVSAWANANRVVLGQVKVDETSNEMTAIPALLQLLDVTGAVVTLEAMGCQKAMVQTMTERGADYVVAQNIYARLTWQPPLVPTIGVKCWCELIAATTTKKLHRPAPTNSGTSLWLCVRPAVSNQKRAL